MKYKELIKFANDLDSDGLTEYADAIDAIAMNSIFKDRAGNSPDFLVSAKLEDDEKDVIVGETLKVIKDVSGSINKMSPVSRMDDVSGQRQFWRARLGYLNDFEIFSPSTWFKDEKIPVLIFGFSQRGIESIKNKSDCEDCETRQLKSDHVEEQVRSAISGTGFIMDGSPRYVRYKSLEDTEPPEQTRGLVNIFVVRLVPSRSEVGHLGEKPDMQIQYKG